MRQKAEERARVPYLHSLRLVHGFDCILCHGSGGKRDKRTSCKEGGGRGGGEDARTVEGRGRGEAEGVEGGGGKYEKEQKQDKRVGHVVVIK